MLVGVISTVLSGCGSSPTEPPSHVDVSGQKETPRLIITEHPFEDAVSLPSVDDLFRLTPEQIQRYEAFKAERIAAARADIEGANDGEDASRDIVLPEHELIGEFLEDMTDHFSYRGKTLVAQDALAEMTGNCMSLAVLTTALARYENVDVGYLLVTDSPVYQKQKSIVVRGQHVRSKLFDPTYEPGPGFLTIMRPSIVVCLLECAGSTRARSGQFTDGERVGADLQPTRDAGTSGCDVPVWRSTRQTKDRVAQQLSQFPCAKR